MITVLPILIRLVHAATYDSVVIVSRTGEEEARVNDPSSVYGYWSVGSMGSTMWSGAQTDS